MFALPRRLEPLAKVPEVRGEGHSCHLQGTFASDSTSVDRWCHQTGFLIDACRRLSQPGLESTGHELWNTGKDFG